MNASEYVTTVEETLRAYDFEPQESSREDGFTVYIRERSGPVRTFKEGVAIQILDNDDVETLKEAITNGRGAIAGAFPDSDDHNGEDYYLLLIPPKVTKAIRVAAERGAELNNDDEITKTTLPVVPDLENDRLVHHTPSLAEKATRYRKMTSRIPDYFRM